MNPRARRRSAELRAARCAKADRFPAVLHDVVAVLGLCADEVSAAGLMETAALLSIAQLDLKARLNGLSEGELSAVASLSADRGGPGRTLQV